MASEPGPMPDPKTDEPEPPPGGPDADAADSIDADSISPEAPDRHSPDGPGDGKPTARDLDPDDNAALDAAAPEEIKEGEDKAQEPEGGTSGEDDLPDEPSA